MVKVRAAILGEVESRFYNSGTSVEKKFMMGWEEKRKLAEKMR
jgi:hypothetical protein